MSNRFFENKHSLELLKSRLEEDLMDISNKEDFHTIKERIDEVNRALDEYDDLPVVEFWFFKPVFAPAFFML